MGAGPVPHPKSLSKPSVPQGVHHLVRVPEEGLSPAGTPNLVRGGREGESEPLVEVGDQRSGRPSKASQTDWAHRVEHQLPLVSLVGASCLATKCPSEDLVRVLDAVEACPHVGLHFSANLRRDPVGARGPLLEPPESLRREEEA